MISRGIETNYFALICVIITHSFPILSLPPWKHQKTFRFSNRKVFWCFQGVERRCIEKEWVKSETWRGLFTWLNLYIVFFVTKTKNLKAVQNLCFFVTFAIDYTGNPLNANPTKWLNTLKQLTTNCLSVFDHLEGLALQGLRYESTKRA